MYLYTAYSLAVQTEDSTLLGGDTIDIYVPAARQFFRDLFAGERLGFSWTNSMGMNVIPYYTSYMGGSIFHLLFGMFPHGDPATLVSVCIILKTGVIGAAFVIFAERVLRVKGVPTVIFALFYAMSGPQIALYLQNYIWMDALYLLPLILTYITDYLERGSWKRLTVAYAYLFISNYYMGYMVGFFSALFLILYDLLYRQPGKRQKVVKKWTGFGFAVILAAGLTAFALLPTALFMITKAAPDATQGNLVNLHVSSLLSSFFAGIRFHKSVERPYLYIGIPTIILTPVFFICKEISRKEKILYGSLLSCMLLSCIWKPLYLFWHAFDAPDGWYYRFSFLISFLLAVMGCRVCVCWKDISGKTLGRIICLELLVGGLAGRIYAKREVFVRSAVMTVLCFGIWAAFAFLVKKKWKVLEKDGKRLVTFFCVVLAVTEVVMNGCMEWNMKIENRKVQSWMAVSEKAKAELEADPSFYRVHYINSKVINWDTFWGINGNSDFGTLENYDLRRSLGLLGAYTSPRVLYSYGQNPFTQMITGVKYVIRGADDYTGPVQGEAEERSPVDTYERFLGLGFLVKGQTADFHPEEPQIYENCNALASAMAGEDLQLFVRIPNEEITVYSDRILMGRTEEGYYIYLPEEEEGAGTITFGVSGRSYPVYATFECGESIAYSESPVILENSDRANNVGDFGVRYSKEVVPDGDKNEVTIAMQKGITGTYAAFQDVLFYECHTDAVDRLYEVLNGKQLQVTEFHNGSVKGTVSVEDAGDILFTSIPYDKGWTLTAGQGGAEMVPLVDGAWIGVRFAHAGTYDLEWDYTVPGLKTGQGISVISLLLFGMLCLIKLRKKDVNNG